MKCIPDEVEQVSGRHCPSPGCMNHSETGSSHRKARNFVIVTMVVAFALTGCSSSEFTQTLEPTMKNPPSSQTASPNPEPSGAPAEQIAIPDHAPEITGSDAYKLCLAKAPTISKHLPQDPRDSYASFDNSYVEAVDGWWRVWIPGITHPNGTPANIALTCAVKGDTDNPTWHTYGGVATDYISDIDAFFNDSFLPNSE